MVALIENLAAHMPEVEIVAREEQALDNDGLSDIDHRVALAMSVLQRNGALRNLSIRLYLDYGGHWRRYD